MTWKLFDEIWEHLTLHHPLGGNMTFLNKLGLLLAKGAAVAAGVTQLFPGLFGAGTKAGAVAGAAVNDLTAIGGVIAQIETALQGKTGADKYAAALALVGPILKTSELVSGKHIADEAKFQLGVQEVTQGVVDLMNSLHEDAAKG